MCAFGPKVKSSVRWCSWLKKRLFTVLALARALQILTIGCLFAMADRPFLFVLEQGDALVRTDTYLVLPLIMLALITLTRKYFFGRWPFVCVGGWGCTDADRHLLGLAPDNAGINYFNQEVFFWQVAHFVCVGGGGCTDADRHLLGLAP